MDASAVAEAMGDKRCRMLDVGGLKRANQAWCQEKKR